MKNSLTDRLKRLIELNDDIMLSPLIHELIQCVEALEKLDAFTNQLCEELPISKHYPSIEGATKALAALENACGKMDRVPK